MPPRRPTAQIRSLVSHLRASGQLTAGLILRAFLSGNVKLFEEALAELSEMPAKRVGTVIHYGGASSLRALFERAGLPPSTYPAFKQAIEAMREGDLMSEPGGSARLKRRMIERVLTGCEKEALDELAPLLTLLRRFATEAAREEARLLCDDMLAKNAAADDVSSDDDPDHDIFDDDLFVRDIEAWSSRGRRKPESISELLAQDSVLEAMTRDRTAYAWTSSGPC